MIDRYGRRIECVSDETGVTATLFDGDTPQMTVRCVSEEAALATLEAHAPYVVEPVVEESLPASERVYENPITVKVIQ
jgi:hypothetical protein